MNEDDTIDLDATVIVKPPENCPLCLERWLDLGRPERFIVGVLQKGSCDRCCFKQRKAPIV